MSYEEFCVDLMCLITELEEKEKRGDLEEEHIIEEKEGFICIKRYYIPESYENLRKLRMCLRSIGKQITQITVTPTSWRIRGENTVIYTDIKVDEFEVMKKHFDNWEMKVRTVIYDPDLN